MKSVAKYNLFKGISTALTFGTPIVTLMTCGEFFKHRSDTSLSAAGIFVILIVLFFAKDKLMENFKVPAPFVLCLVMLILILLIENILIPIKTVCICTLISTGIDEVTFKRMYKNIESSFSKDINSYKHLGFIFTSTNNLMK